MIPVVVSEGVTSLSTLTHVFTLTSTVSLASPATASALPFLDRDTELSSGESVSREAFLPFHNQLQAADKDTDPLSFPDLDSSFVLTPAPQLVAAPAHTPQLQLVSTLQPAPEPDQLQLPGRPLAASPDQLQLPGLPLAPSPDQLANLPALASLSPEQLSYLQLLRQQIPGLPLASFGPQVKYPHLHIQGKYLI